MMNRILPGGVIPVTSREVRIQIAESSIILEEGYLTVCDRYYAKDADARFWRRIEAEKRVDRKERRAAAGARVCVFCEQPIADGEESINVGGADFHAPQCSSAAFYESAGFPTDADFAGLDFPDQAAA